MGSLSALKVQCVVQQRQDKTLPPNSAESGLADLQPAGHLETSVGVLASVCKQTVGCALMSWLVPMKV